MLMRSMYKHFASHIFLSQLIVVPSPATQNENNNFMQNTKNEQQFINSCKIELCMNNLFTQLKLNVNFGECFSALAYCL